MSADHLKIPMRIFGGLAALLLAFTALAEDYNVHLCEGWNLISVTRRGTTLSGIAGSAIQLPGFCARRGSYVPVYGDEELQPGLGYWVFAMRALRSPQDSAAAPAIALIPTELMVWNLAGAIPGATLPAPLNDRVWSWRKTQYRGAFPNDMLFGRGYSVYPDHAQAALSIGGISPAAPVPGELLTVTVSGAEYLLSGGVVWFNDIPAPIVAHSAETIGVVVPDATGTVEIVLDAGHDVMSAALATTIASPAPSLTQAALRNDLQNLAATVAARLGQEHPSTRDADIAAAHAQLLAVQAMLDEFLTAMSSAERNALLLAFENQGISAQLAAFDTEISNRSLTPSKEFASVQAALAASQPAGLLSTLQDLRTSQLSVLLHSGDVGALRGWLALGALARFAETAQGLTKWTASDIIGFRVDQTACDLPDSCALRYYADFAIRHDAQLFQTPGAAMLGDLAEDLDRVLAALPADFAVGHSPSSIESNVAEQIQLVETTLNDVALDSAVPANLLVTSAWLDMLVDMPWMVANGLGYLSLVHSQASSDCGILATAVQATVDPPAIEVVPQAPGFARLDASIFNADRTRVFTANVDLSIEPGAPIVGFDIPTAASSILFDVASDDSVHAVTYSATVMPPAALPPGCFVQGTEAQLNATAPGLRFTEVTTEIVPEGLRLTQSYLLEPNQRPVINELTHQVYAGTFTSIPLTVTGFALGGNSFSGEIVIDDGRDHLPSTALNPITVPFDLPLDPAFNSAIDIEVRSTQLGTVSFFPTGDLKFEMLYNVDNLPGQNDVVTVATGITGIGDDTGDDPPNRSIQELHLEIIKAPLVASFDPNFVYEGTSTIFSLARQFGVALTPAEEAALTVWVEPAEDVGIDLDGGTIFVNRGAEPGFREVTFSISDPDEETLVIPLEVVEDKLGVYLFDNIGYTDNRLEFFYYLESGTNLPPEAFFFNITPDIGLTIDGNQIVIPFDAEEIEYTFSVELEGDSATTTFTVVKDQLHVFPGAPSVFEGNSYDLVLFFDSGKEVLNPLVTIDPPDDVSVEGNRVTFAFGATPGARTVTAVAQGTTATASVTVVDDALIVEADSTAAFPGTDIVFTVSRASGNPVNGQPTLSVAPSDDIVVNGLTLEIASSAALGERTVTATLGNDSAELTINVLGDAEYVAIDLSEGTSAATYTVTRFNALPDPIPEIYKTSSLLLRRVSHRNFTMGSPNDELGRATNEIQHAVTFTSHYYVGVFEVTQRQWELVTGSRPSGNSPADYETLPVENVTYNDIRGAVNGSNWPASDAVDADSFLGLLRTRTGLTLDLPTEAQWENACRSGTTTALNNGTNLADAETDANLDLLGRYNNNADGSSGPVGEFLPNAVGIYDMHGNVWEWCRDWFGSYSGAATDPVGASTGTRRVIRGGSYLLGAKYTRSANRGQLSPTSKNTFFGLRLSGPGSVGLGD